MKNMFNQTVYALSYGLWYVLSLLPMSLLYVLSDCFYFLVAKVVRYRHGVIWKNLTESFPEKDDTELRQIENDFYHSFCDYVVETVKLMSMSKRQLMRRLEFTGLDEVRQCFDNGQSVSVYLGHLFNWEWITSLPYWVPGNVQCCELYHPLENKNFDRLFKRVREKQNALCITMADSLRRILEYKRQRQTVIVGYIADQAPFWNNIHHWVDFLHHDTPVFTGAERIAKHAGQACFYGYIRKVRRGYYVCEMQPMMIDSKAVPDYEITDEYFRRLEANIREYPGIYLWSHRRWKRTHEEYNIRYNPENGRVDLRDIETIKREKGLI
jgi:KDO2-lipid IV(A) lauroyltransferase